MADAAPWEKYSGASAPAEAGPWTKYAPQGPTDQQGKPYVQQPEGSAGQRFGSNLWEKSIGGLIDMGKGVADLAVQGARAASGQIPMPSGPGADMIQGMTLGHIEQAKKTAASAHKGLEAIKKGDVKGALNHYTEAFGHGLATAVPGIGPAAASVGEQLGGEEGQLDKYGNVVTPGKAPDIAGGLGGAAGLIGTAAAPEAVRAVGSRLPAEIPLTPRMANTNPAEAAAMDYLRSKGIPTDAGAETGNAFVRGVQKLADTSPVGSVVSQNALRARTAALRSHATELVAGSTPDVSAETHYTNFRNAEADPANIRPVPTGVDEGGNFTTEDMPLPVKVSELKPALKPIFEEMQWMPMADRNASAGFQAIKKILEGPDFIPASQAEIGLGGIKKMAREGEGRNAGIAKYIVPQLQDLIDDSVSSIGGPKAIESLQSARLAAAKEVGADWLTDTFKKAQAEGGFNREAGLWADWQRLKDPQKRTMFTQQQIGDLDNFFLGVKKLAENPNPSGSGVLANMLTQLTLAVTHPQIGVPVIAGGGLVSKLLHSPAGIKLLTEGISVKNPLAAARVAAKMRTLAGAGSEPPVPPETPPGLPPEEPPTGGGGSEPGTPPPPPPPPGAPPGSGGGAAALQGGLERNAERVAANREKFTGRPDIESKPVQQQPGLTEKPQAIDNPKNAYQYTTPEGIPVYKAPAGEPVLPKGAPKYKEWRDNHFEQSKENGLWKDKKTGALFTDERLHDDYHQVWQLPGMGEESTPGGSPGEPAPGPGRAALQGALQRNAETVEASKAKLTGQDPASWRGKLEQAAADSKQRISQFWKDQGSQANVGIPAHVLADYAVIGAHQIVKGAEKFGPWSQQMLDAAGEQIRPHLRAVWAQSKHIAGQVGWGEGGAEEMPLGKRLTVPGTKVPPAAPPIAQSPAPHLVGRAIENLDAWHQNNPEPFASPENYLKGMSELFQPKNGRVPLPPENLLRYVSDPEALGASIDEVTPGQRKLAEEGLRDSQAVRQLYRDGKATPTQTGMYYVWGGLSPRQSPYPQEAAFLRALDNGMEGWVDKAAAGKFTEKDLPAYMKWADKTLAGTPGAQATSNLHNVGSQFLLNAAKPVTDGPYKGMRVMEALHDIMADDSLSTAEARRRFQQIGKGLGVDNKVFSFVRLVTGHHDALVADRVRINDFWNAPGLKEKGLAFNTNEQGVREPTSNLYDSGLAEPWSGIPGLGMYEGAGSALTDPVRKAYADRGIDDGTLGRWHWETWLAKSGQEVSHGSLSAIQKMMKGSSGPEAAQGEGVRQGKYNDLSYGTRYERGPEGYRFIWEKSGGKTAALKPEQHAELLKTLRSQRDRAKINPGAERVIPYGTKTSESKTAPWRDLPGVNQSALDRLIEQLSTYRAPQ